MSGRGLRLAFYAGAVATATVGCAERVLDAGGDVPHGLLPVDERNPTIILNDYSKDNWLGEYAVLFANAGGPPLAGIVVDATHYWPHLDVNVAGWNELVSAARASGLRGIPDVTPSSGSPLAMPSDGVITSTVPNRSAGAQLIIDLSRRLSRPLRPVVVLTGGQLTVVADAYLMDPTVVERVVVVATIGTLTATGATMGAPNGELDPWADWIVTQRFRYVQVSAYYDQTSTDVTAAQVASLPQNPLGAFMAAKQPDLFTVPTAADQVGIIAVALPTFVAAVQRAVPDTSGGVSDTGGPPLTASAGAAGNTWIATQIAAPLGAARLWQMLLDPRTYAH